MSVFELYCHLILCQLHASDQLLAEVHGPEQWSSGQGLPNMRREGISS